MKSESKELASLVASVIDILKHKDSASSEEMALLGACQTNQIVKVMPSSRAMPTREVLSTYLARRESASGLWTGHDGVVDMLKVCAEDAVRVMGLQTLDQRLFVIVYTEEGRCVGVSYRHE